MTVKNPLRRVVHWPTAAFGPYDMEGPVQPEMSLLRLSYEEPSGMGCYMMRMEPGAVTIAHDHPGFEDYMILEGELIESDGTVLKAGDFVSYAPGTHHNSRTEKGCVLVAFEWGKTPDGKMAPR
jgi:anti-sigma factor ChrR (cupin superfamily)